MTQTDFTIDCTGDVVTGDVIEFSEAVFVGTYRRPQYLGDRLVQARVLRDSYGADRQQHTFTLLIIASSGAQALGTGAQTTRKGRNVYRNGTRRQPWHDEEARRQAAAGKHARGDLARATRDERRAAGR